MSEKRVNKRIRKILEQDLAEAVADVLRAEANGGADDNGVKSKSLQEIALQRAKTLGRFEASYMERGSPPPTPAPGPAKWGNG
jgi:hypothetical protein